MSKFSETVWCINVYILIHSYFNNSFSFVIKTSLQSKVMFALESLLMLPYAGSERNNYTKRGKYSKYNSVKTESHK